MYSEHTTSSDEGAGLQKLFTRSIILPLAALAVAGLVIAIVGGAMIVNLLGGLIVVLAAIAWFLARRYRSRVERSGHDAVSRTVRDASQAVASLASATETATASGKIEPLAQWTSPLPGGSDALGPMSEDLDQVRANMLQMQVNEQEAVQSAISRIVIDLARRSQTLLDRQVELIDSLEAAEEDPGRMEDLFKVDHLATRMRRNAESLLVLAGDDPQRRRGVPVQLTDVLRVAVGEIEHYQRIKLGRVDHALISPTHAFDLAHLTAELMENAASFSPPETEVSVKAVLVDGDQMQVDISDDGVGMSDNQLATARSILESPPELGDHAGRTLGLVVVGRLARRLGAHVTLDSTRNVGTSVSILLPAHLLIDPAPAPAPLAASDREQPPTPSAEEGDLVEAGRTMAKEGFVESAAAKANVEPEADMASPEEADPPEVDQFEPGSLEEVLTEGAEAAGAAPDAEPEPLDVPVSDVAPLATQAETLDEALPSADEFADAIASLLHREAGADTEPATRPESPEPTALAQDPVGPPAGQGETGSGSLLDDDPAFGGQSWTPPTPPPASGDNAKALQRRRKVDTASPPAAPVGGSPTQPTNRRPDEIRSMLSRYRQGIKGDAAAIANGREGDDGTPSRAWHEGDDPARNPKEPSEELRP